MISGTVLLNEGFLEDLGTASVPERPGAPYLRGLALNPLAV